MARDVYTICSYNCESLTILYILKLIQWLKNTINPLSNPLVEMGWQRNRPWLESHPTQEQAGAVGLPATPWTAAHQTHPSMGFSRQEYWSGCHCPLKATQCQIITLACNQQSKIREHYSLTGRKTKVKPWGYLKHVRIQFTFTYNLFIKAEQSTWYPLLFFPSSGTDTFRDSTVSLLSLGHLCPSRKRLR